MILKNGGENFPLFMFTHAGEPRPDYTFPEWPGHPININRTAIIKNQKAFRHFLAIHIPFIYTGTKQKDL